MSNKNNNFRFFVPLTDDITKSIDKKTGKEVMKLGGIASTARYDTDGQSLDPKGLSFDYAMEKGVINWNHSKNPLDACIGEPTKIEYKPNGLYVESILYSESPRAQEVYKLAQILKKSNAKRRLGYSIEGRVTEYDDLDRTRIKKAMLTNFALTLSPKNADSIVDIIKGEFHGWSDNEMPPPLEFVTEEEIEKAESIDNINTKNVVDITRDDNTRITVDENYNVVIQKALNTGTNTSQAGKTGGAPLIKESVDGKTKDQGFGNKKTIIKDESDSDEEDGNNDYTEEEMREKIKKEFPEKGGPESGRKLVFGKHNIHLSDDNLKHLKGMPESKYDKDELKVESGNKKYQIGHDGEGNYDVRHQHSSGRMIPVGNFKLEKSAEDNINKSTDNNLLTKAEVINRILNHNSVISLSQANKIYKILNFLIMKSNTSVASEEKNKKNTSFISEDMLTKALSNVINKGIGDDEDDDDDDDEDDEDVKKTIKKVVSKKGEDEEDEEEELPLKKSSTTKKIVAAADDKDPIVNTKNKPDNTLIKGLGELSGTLQEGFAVQQETNKNLAIIMKGMFDLQKSYEDRIDSLEEKLDEVLSTPVNGGRKSIAKANVIQKSFDNGELHKSNDNGDGKQKVSISQQKHVVLECMDKLAYGDDGNTFDKGLADDMSRYEVANVLTKSFVNKIEEKFNIKLVN